MPGSVLNVILPLLCAMSILTTEVEKKKKAAYKDFFSRLVS